MRVRWGFEGGSRYPPARPRFLATFSIYLYGKAHFGLATESSFSLVRPMGCKFSCAGFAIFRWFRVSYQSKLARAAPHRGRRATSRARQHATAEGDAPLTVLAPPRQRANPNGRHETRYRWPGDFPARWCGASRRWGRSPVYRWIHGGGGTIGRSPFRPRLGAPRLAPGPRSR